MFKNRFFLVLGVLLVLLVTLAISPRGATNDFTKSHSEISAPPPSMDRTDYFFHHPELSPRAESIDLTAYFERSDYYFRHPKLSAPSQSMDLTDYFFRHIELSGR